jgi:hypothetical protein
MEHQYPAPISGDESMLAELMLPDQTHVRSQDWTIFFLHKDTSAEEEDEASTTAKKKRRKRAKAEQNPDDEADDNSQDEDTDALTEESSDEEDDGGEGPPLMYVLNLVNTKQDNTVRRFVLPIYCLVNLSAKINLQRCGGQGYGNLYAPFISSYLQGDFTPASIEMDMCSYSWHHSPCYYWRWRTISSRRTPRLWLRCITLSTRWICH